MSARDLAELIEAAAGELRSRFASLAVWTERGKVMDLQCTVRIAHGPT